MKRRYCIFAAQYFPHLGGVERYTYNLAKKLIEAGDEVTVVTSNVQRIASYEKMEGITVYRMPCINLLDGRYPVLKFNGDFRKIHHILREKNFDFVIVNTRFYIPVWAVVCMEQKDPGHHDRSWKQPSFREQ